MSEPKKRKRVRRAKKTAEPINPYTGQVSVIDLMRSVKQRLPRGMGETIRAKLHKP